ncbi:alkaline phosphatase family protein [Caulobacter sp. CCG-8]|uniref:alkaline phosphatase family protein n=1 Tax=Caulobacter sp. CCG-8 TaxID=3127958 RepID=UPI00307CCCF4
MSLDKIEHVVVLMLENRTFDSLLGWTYERDAPAFIPPATAPYRGLQGVNLDNFVNTALNGTLSAKPTRGVTGFTVPDFAPGESFQQVLTQFYNTQSPPPNTLPSMKGVLEDFVQVLKHRKLSDADIRRLGPMVMQSFTQAQAPVLNQLARHYAVSDAWHASVPSQTNPNRSFLMCGTSNGMINNGDLETDPRAKKIQELVGMAIGDDRVNAPTIFNALATAGADWAVFYETSYLPQKISTLLNEVTTIARFIPGIRQIFDALSPYTDYLKSLTSGNLDSCYTWRLFPQIKDKIPGAASRFRKTSDFHYLARSGRLPKFSYIEPFWSIAHSTVDNKGYENLFSALGNDYHPPGSVLAGEQFVKEIYSSLIANKAAWEKTLLLITFDEFVGSFDHQTADLKAGKVKPPWGSGKPPYENSAKFKFDRLGARVPTIVVSPYVQKGSVFRSKTETPFDHASVITTMMEKLKRPDLVPQFGERAKNAPSFAHAVTLTTPRTDPILPFVDVQRRAGEPVLYGQTFHLKNQNGKYLAPAYCTLKVAGGGSVLSQAILDLLVAYDIAAYFPRLDDKKAPVSFVTQATDPPTEIHNGSKVLLVSREPGPGARNILGAWADSHDCYYHDEYLEGVNRDKQTWVIRKLDNPGGPLRYGERIHLDNVHFRDQRLTQDSRWFMGEWITTEKNGNYWTVEPGPVAV